MQHGGPFPSTTDSRFTSVGATAIRRFVRPVCWQNWEHDLLPEELKDNNPLNIYRLKDKQWTKD
jgi:NADP-dependent aldehyde dehydrogenase